MINLQKIMEHIDRIGVNEARRRIDSYDKQCDNPMTAEKLFGKDVVERIKKEIANGKS